MLIKFYLYLRLNKKDMKYGKTSESRLKTCHVDLQIVMQEVIKITDIDIGIAVGYRSPEEQFETFKKGRVYQSDQWLVIDSGQVVTNIDGINRKGKHNIMPSMAVDIYIYQKGRANWDKETLSYVAGQIHAVAEILYKQGRIEHKIRWGGNWDMDGVMLIDQSFDDRPHFELINL